MADRRRAWLPVSVRARTTIAATLVVTVALAAAGALVVVLLGHNLVGSAELKAEFAARSTAERLAGGTPPGQLNLPEDEEEVIQVVNPAGTVIAASDELEDEPAIGDFAPDPVPSASEDPGGRDDDPDDDPDDYDDDRDDDEDGTITPRVEYRTLTLDEESRYRFAAAAATTPDGKALLVYSGVSLSTEDEAVNDVSTMMLMALPALLLVVAAVTWLVTGLALRPVSAIRAELAEITAGDLSRRVPEPSGRDEIFALARTTNQTLEALETAVSQQRRFIADASHELRSPLAILRAQLEVATSHPELLDVEATLDDVVRLQSLATDLLLLARLDAGERPAHARVQLTELVREEVARRAATDRLPVRLSLTEGVEVFGVANHLVRVLTNLMDNAQRHADAAVEVSLRREGEEAVLTIVDDGAGVPSEKREAVFGRFTRLDDARSRDAGGAGLGLAIVSDVVTAHGGSIDVDDATPHGARFTVRFPVAPEAGA